MQEHIKEHVVCTLHAETQQILGNGQMAGTGNGQKFCHALDDAQDQSVKYSHGKASSKDIFLYDSTAVCDFP